MTQFSSHFGTGFGTKKNAVPNVKTKYRLHNYINAEGKSQVFLHVSGGGQRIKSSLDLYCNPKDWSNITSRMNPKAFGGTDFNLILDNYDSKITKIKTNYRLSDLVLTPEKLISELNETNSRTDFIAYMENRIANEGPAMAEGYKKRCNKVLSKLKSFKPIIYFFEIDHSFFRDYREFCAKRGNSKTTVAGNIAIIKKFLKQATRDGIRLRIHLNDVKRGSMKGNRIDLHPKELQRFHKYYYSEFISPEWRLILGYFLFSCFTSIRWAQVISFNRGELLDRKLINFYVRKNDKRHTIALNQKAKDIVLYDDRLFVNKPSDVHVNRTLKKIAAQLGVHRSISFHVGRHTFGTNFIRAGGDVVKLQKIMGHSNISTTMIYVHIVEQEAHEDMALMDNLF